MPGGVVGSADGVAGVPAPELLAVHDLAASVARLATFRHDPGSGRSCWSPGLPALIGVEPGAAEADIAAHLARLLAPALVAMAAGAPWQRYELEQRVDTGWLRLVLQPAPAVNGSATPTIEGVVVDVTEAERSRRDLADLVDRYRLLVELSPDGVVVHQDGAIVYTNPAALRLAGLQVPAQALGRPITTWIDEQSRPEMLRRIAGLTQPGSVSEPTEVGLLRVDGGVARVEATSVRTVWEDRPAFQVILRDLSAEMRRRSAEARYRTVVAALEEAVLVVDAQRHVLSANAAAERFFRRPGTELVGAWLPDAAPLVDEDLEPLPAPRWPDHEVLATGSAVSQRLLAMRRAGTETVTWFNVNARPLPPVGSGDDAHVVLTFADITDQRNAVELRLHEARHDPLTGLPNRGMLLDRLASGLSGRGGATDRLAAMFIDIDRFKVVNDSLGHEAGDGVIVAVGRRLAAAVRSSDSVGRQGGDEFIVICPGIADIEEATHIARRLGEVIKSPIRVDGRDVLVTASIGIAVTDGSGAVSGSELLRDADVAMYRAKRSGGARWALFDAELRDLAVRRLELENDLRDALSRDELWPAFQPVFSLADGEPVGCEALVRWSHPRHGLVSPAEFIPLAEETGLVVPLGEAMLAAACRQTAQWRRLHAQLSRLTVSVNLSARQLVDPELVETVASVLRREQLPGEGLCLEITESTLMDDPAAAAQTMTQLRELGVFLAIDDFGTGYSSLAYLKRFPVSALKIDRSFVAGMQADGDDAAIVRSVVNLAHSLGLQVIAEGVETEQQCEVLRDLGCDAVQGFLLARPLAAADTVETLLRSVGAGRSGPLSA